MRIYTTRFKLASAGYNSGFTLLELLVTVSILAIVLSLSAPGMRSLVTGQELRSKANLLTSTLAYARNEAVSRVATISVCGSNGAGACSGSTDLSNGWLVFLDENANGTLDGSEELLKQGGEEGGNITLTLASATTFVQYSDQGESSELRNIFLCKENAGNNPKNSRTVVVSVVGSTRVVSGATCP